MTSGSVGVLLNGWFSEVNPQWPGQAMSLEIEETLMDKKSQYQHIQVYKSKTWGNVLVLDGVIQLSTRDESSYQEMIAHLPLFSHPNPEHILVIGGGDGGVIREIVKHSCAKSITICEIDEVVIEAGKKYFPTVAAAWDDPRVKLHLGDGAEFLRRPEMEGKFDVIITDSSDPVGPAESLFQSPFYQSMNKALKAGGKICTQAESMWINLDLIGRLVKDALEIFQNAEYATTQTPTYPAGQIGFLLCSKQGGRSRASCKTPMRTIGRGEEDKFHYYTSELHEASFVLPAFVERKIKESREAAEEAKKEAKLSANKAKRDRQQQQKEMKEKEKAASSATTAAAHIQGDHHAESSAMSDDAAASGDAAAASAANGGDDESAKKQKVEEGAQ